MRRPACARTPMGCDDAQFDDARDLPAAHGGSRSKAKEIIRITVQPVKSPVKRPCVGSVAGWADRTSAFVGQGVGVFAFLCAVQGKTPHDPKGHTVLKKLSRRRS